MLEWVFVLFFFIFLVFVLFCLLFVFFLFLHDVLLWKTCIVTRVTGKLILESIFSSSSSSASSA